MITSSNSYLASAKQDVQFTKTASRTAVATGWFSLVDIAGNPGAGTLAVGNTANGLVPTDATSGYPLINAFGVGATGQLAIAKYSSSVACRIKVYDRLFHAGAFSFNSNVTLASQPSFSSRINGSDYKGTSIWIEAVTAFTGNLSVVITYTRGDGTTGRSTGTFATGVALSVGRMMQVPFQAGDCDVQKIESVVGSVATVGTFNVVILRELSEGRVPTAGGGETHGMVKTGVPIVYADSAIQIMVAPDSTATGIPDVKLQIVNS